MGPGPGTGTDMGVGMGARTREVGVELLPELERLHVQRGDGEGVEDRVRDVHHLRARGLEPGDHVVHDGVDGRRLGRGGAVEEAVEEAEAQPLETHAGQGREVVLGAAAADLWRRQGRGVVARVVADACHDGQRDGEVARAARHRADRVLGEADGDDAGPRDQAPGGPEAEQRVRAGRAAERVDRVGARGEHGQAGGDGGAAAAAAPPRRAGQVVRVDGLAAEGRDGQALEGHLVQVRLAENDGARVGERAHGRGVGLRLVGGESAAAAGGGHADGVEVVLEEDGDAEERARRIARCETGVQAVCYGKSGGVQRDDRVDDGVELLNARNE